MERAHLHSSGFLLFRRADRLQFLLMRHPTRWDLPKGHLDPGESSLQAAWRELREETGLDSSQIWLDTDFRYVTQYPVTYRRKSERENPSGQSETRLKELSIYLGFVVDECPIVPTEHMGCRWFDWDPPHQIQSETIDSLLEHVQAHFEKNSEWPPSQVQ